MSLAAISFAGLSFSSFSSMCSAFQVVAPTSSTSFTPTMTSFMRGKMTSSLCMADDDDFFDGYDDFLSNLDFNDKGWSNENPIGYGNDGGAGRGGRSRGRDNNSSSRRRSDSFGGHDYERARDDDASMFIDETKVNSLISQRLTHRKRGEFDQADDIRDHLLSDFGVTLWDKERVWTTNPDRRGGSNRHSGNGRYAQGGRGDRGGRGGRGDRGGRGGRRERKPRDFGPNGHDYEMTGNGIDPSICTLEVKEINSLLAERLQAKMSRDFQTADAIQDHLRDKGVLIMDGAKEWRADGLDWDRSERTKRPMAFTSVREYARRGPCKGIPEEEVDEITKQIQMRSELKAERDYDAADAIKFELSDKYDITIDDRMLTWAVRSEEYLLSRDSEVIPDEETQEKIGMEFRLRIIAKQNKDFDAADAIRDELYEKYGVVITDRLKEYIIERKESFVDDNDDWNDDLPEENSVVEELADTVLEGEEEINPLTAEDLEALTIPTLKDKLRDAGLPVSGKKAELIERLLSN